MPSAIHARICGPAAAGRREEQGYQIGVDFVHAAEFAAQEAGDQFAVDRRIETRKMNVFALHATFCEQLAQHPDLGRLARSVQAFEYDEHR